MERLKVLFITAWYPTKEQPVGGVFVREHAKAVQLYDDVVVLHCSESDSNRGQLWRMQQETDRRLTEDIPTYRSWYRPFPIPKIRYLIYLWTVFKAFRRIVSQGFRPHIIHAHIYEVGVPAVLIGKLYRIPMVITEHFSQFPRKTIGGIEKCKAKFVFESGEIVIPVSKSLQKSITEYGIKARFQIVPNVVNTDLFNPGSSSKKKIRLKHLIFVGALDLSHNKGVHYLLNAVALLREHRDDWHLDIVGDGPARPEYESMVQDLGLVNRVTFHGFKTREEVAELMRQASLFVLPSLIETFSLVAAEALATGLPVLATRCGGPEDFIDEDVGLLVPPGDEAALCKGLDFMLDNLYLASRKQIHQYAKGLFSPEIVGAKLHEIYTSLKSSK
jgi:glycosyltransferase involved in cell wall biosynthesis